jgi:CRP-like cAMP-binding protein
MPHKPHNTAPPKCANCACRDSALCSSIRRDDRGAAQGGARSRTLAPGTALFHEGEVPESLGIVRSGYLRIQRITPEGDRRLLGVAAPGDLVGALPGRTSRFSVEASTRAELCMFERQGAERLMLEDHAFRRQVLDGWGRQLEQLRAFTLVNGALSARERILASLLLSLRFLPTEPHPERGIILHLPLPRRDWADLLNTTVESISRAMTVLAREGLASACGRGRLHLPDPQRLSEIAGLDMPYTSVPRWLEIERPDPLRTVNAPPPQSAMMDARRAATDRESRSAVGLAARA